MSRLIASSTLAVIASAAASVSAQCIGPRNLQTPTMLPVAPGVTTTSIVGALLLCALPVATERRRR